MHKALKIITLIFILQFFALQNVAQNTFQKTIGAVKDGQGFCVHQTTDGGYIIGGIVSIDSVNTDIYLIKTNAAGDTLFTKTYGGPQGEYQSIVQQTADGGYIISGSTYSYGAGQGDIFVVKTNALGDTLWTKTYGGTGDEIGQYIQQTIDGGYIIGGHTDTFGPRGDFYLIKINSLGDTLWTRNYGGSQHDHGFCVQQTTDGGYIQIGHSVSFAPTGGFYIVKTDANGDTLFTRGYGGAADSYGYFVQQTTDGGYILVGSTNAFNADSTDALVIKTDANGDTLWSKKYGGPAQDYFNCVKQTPDGGYILLGTTNSFGFGNNDIYAVKINAVGDTLWSKTYGGLGDDEGAYGSIATDSGYVITGFVKSFGTGAASICLIKTDKHGNTNCNAMQVPTKIVRVDSLMFNVPTQVAAPPTQVGAAPFKISSTQNTGNNFCSTIGIQHIQQNSITLYPIPANQTLTLQSQNQITGITIYNTQGQQVYQQKTNNNILQIDVSNLSPGMYILHSQNQHIKFIKQ